MYCLITILNNDYSTVLPGGTHCISTRSCSNHIIRCLSNFLYNYDFYLISSPSPSSNHSTLYIRKRQPINRLKGWERFTHVVLPHLPKLCIQAVLAACRKYSFFCWVDHRVGQLMTAHTAMLRYRQSRCFCNECVIITWVNVAPILDVMLSLYPILSWIGWEVAVFVWWNSVFLPHTHLDRVGGCCLSADLSMANLQVHTICSFMNPLRVSPSVDPSTLCQNKTLYKLTSLTYCSNPQQCHSIQWELYRVDGVDVVQETVRN